MDKKNRNPKECHWAMDIDGIYICRGMCLPCSRVKDHDCDMEQKDNLEEEN